MGGGGGGGLCGVCEMEVMRKTLNKALQCVYLYSFLQFLRACVPSCVRACERASERASVRACVRACVRVCVCVWLQ